MARLGKLRLLYRVAFICFCVIFVCSYHHDTSRYDKRKYETKYRKLKKEFKDKSSDTKHNVHLKRGTYASSSRNDIKHLNSDIEKKEPKISRIKRNGKFKLENTIHFANYGGPCIHMYSTDKQAIYNCKSPWPFRIGFSI